MLTAAEKDTLRARLHRCHIHGWQIAKPETYVAALGGGDPPAGVEPGSVAHLLYLLDPPAVTAKPTPAGSSEKKEPKGKKGGTEVAPKEPKEPKGKKEEAQPPAVVVDPPAPPADVDQGVDVSGDLKAL